MAEIKVNSQMLRDASTSLMAELGNFQQITNDVSTGLNNLSNDWTGEAFNNFQANVQALNPTFEKYAEVINQYADFLNKSADQYDQAEATISNETNNIVNDLFK